jgi:hypothetical protein
MSRFLLIAAPLLASALAACSTTPTNDIGTMQAKAPCATPAIEGGWLTTRDANRLVYENSDHCQPAAIAMTVRSVMRINDVLYLNSENDPRDGRNFSLAILPQAQQELTEFFHGSPDTALQDKDLVVTGTARLLGRGLTNPGVVRVHFREDGVAHVVVTGSPARNFSAAHGSGVIVESASQMWMKQPRASLDPPAS